MRSVTRAAARLFWPCLILLSAVTAAVAMNGAVGSAARAAATLWFVLVCPGMAYVRLLTIGDVLIELGLAVALSTSLATTISLAMVYLKLWHPAIALYLLVAIAVFGVFLQLKMAHATRPPVEARS